MAVLDFSSAGALPDENEAGVNGGRILDFETGLPMAVQPKAEEPEFIEEPQEVIEQTQIESPSLNPVGGPPEFGLQEDRDRMALANGNNSETRATRELPELVRSGILAGESLADIAKISAATAVTMDPRELGAIITNILPHIGITEDEKGNILASNNKNGVQSVINPPGPSVIDAAQVGATTAAFVPGASLATIPAGLGMKAAVGATGAGLTQSALEGLQSQLGGEFSKEEIAIATSLGGVAELVFPAIQALRQSKQSGEVAESINAVEDVAAQVRTGTEASEATGIPLFQAQQTTIPAQLERQSFIASLPAGTQKASKELAKQNLSASKAIDDFISTIAPDDSIVKGQGRIRTAAQNAVASVKRIRKEASSPIYKQAFRRQRQGKVALIDTSKLQTKIIEMAKQFDPKGQIAINLEKALNKIQTAGGNLQKLHLAKTEIDQTIESFGADSVGNTTKRFLSDVKRDLTDVLVDQSPSYRAARSEFMRLSPPVDEITQSIIGKVANLSDTQLKTASKILFDPQNVNVSVIRAAKKVVDDVDPDAWNMILRSEIERRMGSIKSTLEETSTENIPGQLFRSIFGATKQRNVLFAGVQGKQKVMLKYFETALNRASLGRPGGSQTQGRAEMVKEIEGGVRTTLVNFFSGIFSPSEIARGTAATLTGATANASFNKRVRALADIMFDPQWKPRVNDLIKLNSNSPAAGRALTQLLDDAIIAGVDNFNEGDQVEAEK